MTEDERVLLSDVEVDGRRVDVRVDAGVVVAVRPHDSGTVGDVDGHGGALLPGLHDHHVHLLATAAALRSVPAGPPQVTNVQQLGLALAGSVGGDGWVRAVGYDESVAGELDRQLLDRLRADAPVRVQHSSGALWTVNSAGAQRLALDTALHRGVERGEGGRPTGRLWRADSWLAERLSPRPMPDLGDLGTLLTSLGLTGVTDATPSLDAGAAALLATLPVRVTLLAADLDDTPPGVALGPAKLVAADHELPSFDELTARVQNARSHRRAVAVHCVTREALLLTLAVLADAGTVAGDRIEHAAVAPPDAVQLAAGLGVAVVTQPSLVARRGDNYLDRVGADDLPHLWPWASFTAAGAPVAGSSDAPYGDLDPWAGVRAAVARRSPSGRLVAGRERVTAAEALAGWLSPADAPGGPVRRVAEGAHADLVLLDVPLAEALGDPDARHVRITLVGGHIVHDRDGAT